jgi:CHAT domain-containing protein
VSLGLTYDVDRAPSLAVRALQRARVPATGGAVLVDSVPMAAGLRAEFGLDELRFSGPEGDLVLRAWPDAHRLRGADATLAGLRARLVDPPRVLHISSHALTHGAVPSTSLLLLADGSVPLSSLADLRLGGSTVVLSACSSATGQPFGGEGDAGLLWGPLGAGARSVVASVWQVNQQATCDLMGQLHYALARGESEARALRHARQALAAAPNYAHPHYWAGFAAFGASPDEPRRAAWWQIALLVVGVFAFALIWRRSAR